MPEPRDPRPRPPASPTSPRSRPADGTSPGTGRGSRAPLRPDLLLQFAAADRRDERRPEEPGRPGAAPSGRAATALPARTDREIRASRTGARPRDDRDRGTRDDRGVRDDRGPRETPTSDADRAPRPDGASRAAAGPRSDRRNGRDEPRGRQTTGTVVPDGPGEIRARRLADVEAPEPARPRRRPAEDWTVAAREVAGPDARRRASGVPDPAARRRRDEVAVPLARRLPDEPDVTQVLPPLIHRSAAALSPEGVGRGAPPSPPRDATTGDRGPGRPGWVRGLVALAAALLIVVVASLVVRATHGGEALPGTKVAGIDVSGLSAGHLADRLGPSLGADRAVLLRVDGRTTAIEASKLGYTADLERTARAAVGAGRGGGLDAVVGPLRGIFSSRQVPVAATFDDGDARRALGGLTRRIDRTAYAGALRVDPETFEVRTDAPRSGRRVDTARLVARIRRALRTGDRAVISVPLKSVPAVSEGRLQTLASDAEDYVREPLQFEGAGRPFELSTAETASILTLDSRSDGRKARLGAGGPGLSAVLDRVQARVPQAARDARIQVPATGASLTAKGNVTWSPKPVTATVTPSRAGRGIDRTRLAGRIEAAVRAGRHTVQVPTRIVQPEVTTEQASKVDQLIGTFTTPYVAGQPRVQNIQRMARAVDGTLIAPGAQFSLNGIVGERTTAKGYVEAPFIAGNRIQPSVGGGVSQFSTTMYNAAYFAGLQIDQHRAHSLYIDRYPPGRESTLNFPDIDMRWTNDTGAPVLVRTSYDDAGVTVTLYGDNGGRRVTAKAGRREPVDGGDFQITVTRTIRYGDGHTASGETTTRYENEQEGPSE